LAKKDAKRAKKRSPLDNAGPEGFRGMSLPIKANHGEIADCGLRIGAPFGVLPILRPSRGFDQAKSDRIKPKRSGFGAV
jgi:hypothetical protein